jgi:hypothetical protein
MRLVATVHVRFRDKAVVEPLETVIFTWFSGSYKNEFIREFERFFIEHSSDRSRSEGVQRVSCHN